MYAQIAKFLKPHIKKSTLFRYGFNISPMYRRSTGRVYFVSEDLLTVKIKIPLSIKNRNYVGSIFGGSLFSATDPIYMVQLINILGDDYIVWDKSAGIRYKRPAKETVYAEFNFTEEEIERIKKDAQEKGELEIIKELNITNKEGTVVFSELVKQLYIADKKFYKQKRKEK